MQKVKKKSTEIFIKIHHMNIINPKHASRVAKNTTVSKRGMIALILLRAYGRQKWQPTPVFLPGESRGWRSLVG